MLKIERVSDNQIKMSGRFDAAQVAKANEELSVVTDDLIVDLSELEYISSAGLGALVETQQRLAETDSKLSLANMNAHIRDIFRISGLDQLFEILER